MKTSNEIVLQQKAEGSSEMSVNFYQTTYCHVPHNSILHTHCSGRMSTETK